MLRGGFTTAAVMPDLPPLGHYNGQAVVAWNMLDGKIAWPDVLFVLSLTDVDSLRLMVQRLYTLRDCYR